MKDYKNMICPFCVIGTKTICNEGVPRRSASDDVRSASDDVKCGAWNEKKETWLAKDCSMDYLYGYPGHCGRLEKYNR